MNVLCQTEWLHCPSQCLRWLQMNRAEKKIPQYSVVLADVFCSWLGLVCVWPRVLLLSHFLLFVAAELPTEVKMSHCVSSCSPSSTISLRRILQAAVPARCTLTTSLPPWPFMDVFAVGKMTYSY